MSPSVSAKIVLKCTFSQLLHRHKNDLIAPQIKLQNQSILHGKRENFQRSDFCVFLLTQRNRKLTHRDD